MKSVCSYCGAGVRRCVEKRGSNSSIALIVWRDRTNIAICEPGSKMTPHKGVDLSSPSAVERWLES